MSVTRRALHFVLKVGDLKKNLKFFRDDLGMKVLRHEVFDKGCEAACNGPYSDKWSKTMIGFGSEDDHFVLELTYNYSVSGYKLGNDLQYIRLALHEEGFSRVNKLKESNNGNDGSIVITSPDGYKFVVSQTTDNKQDIVEVCLSCQNLKTSSSYWNSLLNMKLEETDEQKGLLLAFAKDQASLRLKQTSEKIDHKSAYGRIAFSCPSSELKTIQKTIEDAGHKVLTPFLSLDTPNKATVQVVILADPDGHEICFVGDEGFRELSKVDPEANDLIEKSILEDKSDEWFEKRNQTKSEV